MAYRSLPKFNPDARFIASRAFLFNGHEIQPGELVEGVPTRRLRQLFEMRMVAAALDTAPRKQAVFATKKGRK